jgi:hypothetical protein
MAEDNDTPLDRAIQNEAAVMLSEPIIAACKAYFVDAPLLVTAGTLRFAAHRFAEQAELLSALTSCRAPSEAVQAQMAFLRSAADDYGKEARTIVHRVTDTLS